MSRRRRLANVSKRLFVGRPLRNDRLGETLLPKKLALPVFASDALSSVAYATEEILLVLSVGGLAYYRLAPLLAAGVVVLMLVVVASYRQNVHAYPSGGGDYEVATTNLGPPAGLAVASALLVDYVLTVAVSICAGVAAITSAFRGLEAHKVGLALACVIFITAMNLRGVRESGTAFAVPTYGFIAGIAVLMLTAAWQFVAGDAPRAETADYTVAAEQSYAGLAVVFLALRAFSSGCTALTGVEAISNGVPAFQHPKSRNAATTLLLMGSIAVTMFIGVTVLAIATHVRITERTADLVGLPAGHAQRTVLAQITASVFGDGSLPFFYIQAFTAGILVLAANTAFNGFPVLGSILAQDRYLPRQLHTRGDRLAFSNGIVALAGFAALLIVAFQAEVTRLIQLYIIGVFVSFTCSQTGMVRHWRRLLAVESHPAARRRMRRSQAINTAGAVFTGLVLIIVLATKFARGAWIVVVAMPVIYAGMRTIRRHYDGVSRELAATTIDDATVLPSRNHAVVLVSKIHPPTLRALSYARATRASTLVAVTVRVDEAETDALADDWERRKLPVPLVVLDSPYREITRPVLRYVAGISRASPRDVVTVFVPEYVVGHWWEALLHNQSAFRIKTRLRFLPGVMVTSVPYQLRSSGRPGARRETAAPGQLRRLARAGLVDQLAPARDGNPTRDGSPGHDGNPTHDGSPGHDGNPTRDGSPGQDAGAGAGQVDPSGRSR